MVAHVLRFFPKALRAHRLLAASLDCQDKPLAAFHTYLLVTSIDPLDGAAYDAMAQLAVKLRRPVEADFYTHLASDHHSGRDDPLQPLIETLSKSRLAILQERSGLTAQAADTLRELTKAGTNRLDLVLLLARTLYQLRSFEASEAVVVTLLASSPDLLEANLLGAALRFRQGRDDEGAHFLNAASEVDPTGRSLQRLLVTQDLEHQLARRPQAELPERDWRSGVPPPKADEPSRAPAQALNPRDDEDAGVFATRPKGGHDGEHRQGPLDEFDIPRTAGNVILAHQEPNADVDSRTASQDARENPGPTNAPTPAPANPAFNEYVASTQEEHPVDDVPLPAPQNASETNNGPVPLEIDTTEELTLPTIGPSGDPASPDVDETVAASEQAASQMDAHFPDLEEWFQENVLDAVGVDEPALPSPSEPDAEQPHIFYDDVKQKNQAPAGGLDVLDDHSETKEDGGEVSESFWSEQKGVRGEPSRSKGQREVNSQEVRASHPAPAPVIPLPVERSAADGEPSRDRGEATAKVADSDAGDASEDRGSHRRWSLPGFDWKRQNQPVRSRLADLAEIVEREPLNNGARFELAKALESADSIQAVAQYGVLLESRDPRLVGQVREQLEGILAVGTKVHGLQRLLGDAYMQQGTFERAIEAYSLAFDELRSRQITDRGRRV